jgi:DNA polymerase III subunit gamma/tau
VSALYRTYRPQDFDEVVGQQHVVRTLRNAIELDAVAHAYLFAGPRGTGKTSMAKILAKALNCEQGPTTTPDKTCESCRAIHDATSIDVLELDAASHRGIDDIREIRDRVAMRPARGRKKVYIVDEAHMLTKEASNAVLKTLEEPPEHVVFVLCTTEAAAMLPTIRSRCQRFAFFRPGVAEIEEVLRRIATAEGIEADAAAMRLIARSAGGSFRDAVSTLDQLATAGGRRVAPEDVRALLGTTDEELLFEALDLVAAGDGGGCLRHIDHLVESGADLGSFVADLLAHLRQVFLVHQIGELPADAPLSAEGRARVEDQAARLQQTTVIRFVDLLRDVLDDVKEGADPRLPLEMAFVKAARPETQLSLDALAARIEQLEAALAGGADPPAARAPAPAAPAAEATPSATPTPAAPAPAADLDDLRRLWDELILPEVGRRSIPLQALVALAEPVGYGSGEVVLGFPRSKAFAKTTAESTANVELLRGVIGQAVGEPVSVRMAVVEDDDEPEPAPPEQPLTEGELIAQLKDEFDARDVEEAR